ncbi:MAG: Gfo/Idh/MocA family protein [Streptosporangiaceae bacterium]
MTARQPDIGIAVVGSGAMAKAHAYGYTAAPLMWSLSATPRLVVLCGRDAAATERTARVLGFADYTTDWQRAVARADVDIVDICTPPGAHADVIVAAAAAGKAVICEKPLTALIADAVRAVDAVRSAGVLTAIGFNYRRLPAVALMQQMIAAGGIGTPLLWRSSWLSDEFSDPSTAFDWRFDQQMGASTIADLGSHLIDLAEWMVGPITDVCGQSQTATPVRREAHGGGQSRVSVDESSSALLQFAGGAQGIFEVSKTCVRHPCDFTVEVNGSDGTVIFEYERLNELRYGNSAEPRSLYGMHTIRAEDPVHPYAAHWWAIGQGVGYGASFVNTAAELLAAWPDGPWVPDLQTGLRVQQVCAAIESSVAERRWTTVPRS